MNKQLLSLLTAILLISSACVPKIDGTELSSGDADLSRPVILGGGMLAGYMDGALYKEGQVSSTGTLILNSFSEVSGGTYQMWTMPDDEGLGMTFKYGSDIYQSRGRLDNVIDCNGDEGLSVARMDASFSAADAPNLLSNQNLTGVPNNLAIPYSYLSDWLNPGFGDPIATTTDNPYYPMIASDPGVSTVISDAQSLNPTFVVMAPGFWEIMAHATFGNTQNPIPNAATFEAQLDSVVGLFANNGAKGCLSTVPSFRHLAFFNTVPALGADVDSITAADLNGTYQSAGLDSLIKFEVGPNGFVIEDSSVYRNFRMLTDEEFMLLNVPLDSVKCFLMGILFSVMPERYYLTVNEATYLDQMITAYNQAITNVAVKHGFALADMNTFFDNLDSGLVYDGVDFDASFVSGGFLSLDGLHPNPKGAALLANAYIEAINAKYNAVIPTHSFHDKDGVIFP